jgi:tRNA(Ser,Leu) C12 N-acetylase TAN1
MDDWNVIVTVYQDRRSFRRALNLLRPLGEVAPSAFHNVLLMRVESIEGFLRDFSAIVSAEPGILNDISRVVPVTETFSFRDQKEFEESLSRIALAWLPMLMGRSFHVRMHRRGLKAMLQSPTEERFLDEVLLAGLKDAQSVGRISFDDPDVVIDVESLGHRAGVALWTREDRARFPFLKLD